MPSAHNVYSSMGDTCKGNATIDTFLSTHNPSWLMDFYQIFIQVSKGVNATRNSNPEKVPVGLPVGIISDQRKWAIRSAKQDDIYGASNITLPCPGN
jgi:hypothetical protein